MRAARWLWVLALAVSFSGAEPVPAQSPRRRALLIGIDDYVVVRDLRGCVNDIERFKSMLIGKFGFNESEITMLRNAQATRAGIFKAFESLISAAQANDIVVVHYSGHGSRVQDVSSDEEDGWDETIVPQDSRQAGVFDITDDDINGLLGRLTAKTTNVTVVMDSCHSGSVTRGGAEVRRAPDDQRQPPRQTPSPRAAEGADDFRQRDAAYVLITGSRPHELSNEFDVDGVRQGALTHFLTRTLLSASAGATYRSVMETVGVHVTNAFPSQHPQLEGAGDRVIFDIAQTLAAPYVLVNPQGNGATVEAGAVHGLAAGSELDVYAPGSLVFTSPVARIRLTSTVGPLQSQADVVSGGPIAKAARAVIRTRTYPDAKLRIHLSPANSTIIAALRKELSQYPGFELVTDDARADLRLRHERNLIFTESADLVQLSPALTADSPDAVNRIVDRAKTWMRWFAILRLENVDTQLPMSLKVGDGTKTKFTSGDQVVLTITNLSSERAFLTLLNLDADGGITPLSPASDRTDPIPPSGSRTRAIKLETPTGRPFVPDVLKAILTTSPLDPALFTQAAARSVDPQVTQKNPLERLIAQTAAGQSRAATLVESANWGTATARVETWQRATAQPPQPSGLAETPRLEGFVLHYPEGGRGAPPDVTSRGVAECPATGAQPDECWLISPMGPASASVEVRPAGRSAGTRAPLSLGAAWDEAERLRQQTGAEVVEPVFEVAIDEEQVDPAARSGGGTPDKEGAKRDNLWSLRHVNAEGARTQLRETLKRPRDAEAAGVIVAHPDTGYRQHPEFWDADAAKSPVMFESGWNFVENNSRPLDSLDDSGTLANPAHGTKSGSVIVSPPGKQWPGGSAAEFVTGVAPGARLVPLRVHTSVVHFNPSRLAQAINYAAEPDGTKIRLPAGTNISVISISMGGLPSLALYKAVRKAEKNGVLLIAAAGNQVKTVVWPARFDSAVAVAATNIDCDTWPGSSRGGAVDFAAPGESVWHASVSTAGENGINMGQGTTFATATSAGIAALWVSRNRDLPLFDKLKREGRLTDAFRAAVQKTSWRPGATGTAAPPAGVACAQGVTWNSNNYGAGIIDADRLLREPLTEPPAPRALDESPYPLFESLFVADVPSSTVAERLTTLFPGTPPTTLRALEGELTTLYALDSEVQAAVDAVTTEATPPASAFAAVREVLRRKDISTAMVAATR